MRNLQLIKIYFGCLLLAAIIWCVPSQAQTDSLPVEPHPEKLQVRSTSPVVAQSTAALWDAANTAYINADYHTAIEVYERIMAQGLASGKLYYNIGNAYFKEGNLSKAILFYNRAQRLIPGNVDVNYNLDVAKSRTKDNIEQIPEFFATTWLRGLRHTMGCTSWSIVSLSLLVFMLGLLLLYLLAQRIMLRKVGFYGTVTMFVLCVISTWFAVLERQEILRDDEAIIMVVSSAVKSSPDHAATDLFMLHEGTKVVVSDRLDTWCEITLTDGKKGWIESRKIEII
ncbi:MAG: tetratricopeptide repeat protein [Alistipes sp.]